MLERRAGYSSDAKYAVSLGINSAQYSRIARGELEGVVGDPKWIAIARRLDVQLAGEVAWKTAKTPVFTHIYSQLAACQQRSLSALLCDMADVGKTYTARCYVREHKGAVYVDCSQVKSKAKLIRQIAKEFGLGSAGRYADVYEDLAFYLRSSQGSLIILDEAGDLDYKAFLELKALWNATEGACGWYMMGADGLREKMEQGIRYKKVGYAEMLSRFGVHDERVRTARARFQKVTPDGREALEEFVKTQVALIAKANGVTDIQQLFAKTGGSLRRIRTEVQKLSMEAAA